MSPAVVLAPRGPRRRRHVAHPREALAGPMAARAAQGDKKVRTQGRTGTGRHGGVSEKVVEKVEVQRYWPGKTPKWVDGDEAADDDGGFLPREQPGASAAAARPDVADRRLQRLAERSAGRDHGGRRGRGEAAVLEEGGDSDDDGRGRGRRRHREAAVLEEAGAEDGARADEATGAGALAEDEEDDDDAIEARRERLRAMRIAARAREEEALAREGSGEEEEAADEDESEGSSEYETDTDDEEEDGAGRVLLKPVFVTDADRETIRQREAAEEEEVRVKEARAARLQERSAESRQMLVEIVRQEEESGGVEKKIDFEDMPDDSDEAQPPHHHHHRHHTLSSRHRLRPPATPA